MKEIRINPRAEIRWETISEDQSCVIVDDFLQEHFPTYRKPACYMTGSNEIAELLCTIPARFNRLIFYSGTLPHSATITAPELLSGDIRKGRLTLNIFADVLPR